MARDEIVWVDSPAAPPPEAHLPERHPDAIPVGEMMPAHYDQCYGCGREHPGGLRLQVVAGDLSIHATFEVTDAHQGAPGLAHGGLLATAFDEALGALNWLLMAPAVTARLETDFRKPVPVGSVLHIDAEIVGISGRKVYTRGVARIGLEGPVALTARAMFVQVGLEHFIEHGDAEVVRSQALRRGANIEVNP